MDVEERIAFFTEGAAEAMVRRINGGLAVNPPVPCPRVEEIIPDPREELIADYIEFQRRGGSHRPWWRFW